MSVGLVHYLVLASILFCIGVYGALTKRNAVVILMCIELMLNAVNIALVVLSRYWGAISGQVFVIFVLVVAAAEAAVGLAIIMAIYRSRRSVDPEDDDLMKG
jgi:NADH:ubiquinone oxidoreductase subunit K